MANHAETRGTRKLSDIALFTQILFVGPLSYLGQARAKRRNTLVCIAKFSTFELAFTGVRPIPREGKRRMDLELANDKDRQPSVP